MESFEVTIMGESFKVTHENNDSSSFSVFNHTTFHVIEKTSPGSWKTVQHRFGKEILLVNEIGAAIEKYLQAQINQHTDLERVSVNRQPK